MSAFTDRLVAAGVVASVANKFETDVRGELAKAKAAKARLTARIDALQTELDGLKAERRQADTSIDAIRASLGEPNA